MLKEIGMKEIETGRLILRKFTLDDVDGMYNNWASDFETSKMLDWDVHENREVTLSVISNWIKEYEKLFYFNWVVELKENGEIIGNIEIRRCKLRDEICEIGYCYGSKYWNNGYASEALRAVIQFLINEVGVRIVEAKYISGNPASGKVMEKAGMKKDAVLRARVINKNTGDVNDFVIYSIMKEEL
ncbi:MAG: GNAT family N-acetyltransferase [Oscillospiraceae bacterium]|nr:GNAT family N-acetyltransferase [Oscillospiraceae bacterium]